jgi:hypothetical protein
MDRHIEIMIAGAEKAGTSSLKAYLGQHPELAMHPQQELMYFAADDEYRKGLDHTLKRYYGAADGRRLVAKSVAIMYVPEAAMRLHDHNPQVRIVIVLRNPVDRAYSAYWHSRLRGWEQLDSFEQALEAEPGRISDDERHARFHGYRLRGQYDVHLRRLMATFSAPLEVFLTEDLASDPAGVCRSIFAAAGVDESFAPDVSTRDNASAAARSERFAAWLAGDSFTKRALARIGATRQRDLIRAAVDRLNSRPFTPPPMDPETRMALVQDFQRSNERVAELIDRDLADWNR